MAMDNPPSFYDDDMRKWSEKFSKAVKARDAFKKQYMTTQQRTIFTSNEEHT